MLWWLLWHRQRAWVIAYMVLSFLATGVSIAVANTTVTIIDEAIKTQSRPLGGLINALIVLAFVDFLAIWSLLQITSRIEYQIEIDLRNRLYVQLQRASPRDLDSVATGQMVTRSLSDLELLQVLMQVIPLITAWVPILLGYTVYLAFKNVPLTLLTLSLFGFNGWLVNRIRPRLWGLAFLNLNQRAELTAAIDEPVRGMRVVKAFGGEERERDRVRAMAAKAFEFLMTRARLEARFDLFLRAAPMLVRAALLLFGARLVVSGGMSLGDFVVFFTFLSDGTVIAQYLDELVAVWQLAKTGAGRITQLLGVAPSEPAPRTAQIPEPSRGLQLSGAGVRFGDVTTVADVNLLLAPGTFTVLTGGPGSGKSIVASMAAGLLAPTEGTVTLEGVEVATIEPSVLHRAVHLVSEEPFLFARTVRENLTIGALAGAIDADAHVDDEQLWAAIRAAGADDVVSGLDGGLDGVLGDRGMTLSGGQRQRIALARALVAPPRVLVLDDALSAVNPGREVEILSAVREHAPRTAVLCITRRPGPRELADTIVELPPAGDHRPLAVGAADAFAAVDALQVEEEVAGVFAAFAASDPYDPRLVEIISSIKLSGDVPTMPEAAATEWREPPRLWALLTAQPKHLLLAVAGILVFTAVNLVPEFLFGEAADYVEDANTGATDKLAMGIVAVAVVAGVSQYCFRIFSAQVNQGVLFGLRRRIFERLSRLGIDFYDRELPGYVSARVVHDIDSVARFMEGDGLGEPGGYRLVSSMLLFSGAMAIIAVLSPQVALVVLPFVIAVMVLTLFQIRIADRAFATARRRLGDVVARLQEDFAGRYVISAFGAEERSQLDFRQATVDLRRARRWAATVSNSYIGLITLALGLAAAFVYSRAGTLALAGVITTGTVVSLRLYLDSALRPIRTMGRVWQEFVRTRVSMRQLSEPFAVPILPVEDPDARVCTRLEGRLAFEGVSFTYPGTTKEVVHDLSFAVAPGEVVALVGYTGAGKSSIAKLLGRIYDPDSGRVVVDGTDVRALDLRSYRLRLGIVPQDAFVFRGTVVSNISYGRPDATGAEIEAACRAVGAWDTLSELEGSLSGKVDEEGRNLTAAERQLIALARMWMVEPDVLVLDEATASLDAATESAVLDAVCGLGRSTLLITHRLAVAERADRVILIDDGRVVEEGTHVELLARDSHYSRLWTFTGQADGPDRAPAITT